MSERSHFAAIAHPGEAVNNHKDKRVQQNYRRASRCIQVIAQVHADEASDRANYW